MNRKRANEEDTTKYGEFISSYFAWVPPEKQKDIVNNLENMTKKVSSETEQNGNLQNKEEDKNDL